jgi:O-antigen/teichoic acid export membrane protein
MWEVCFSGVTVRLPDGAYSTFWALFKIFFIVTVPLMAFQFVVTKEVAAYSVLGEFGKRRYLVGRTLLFSMIFACALVACGMAASGFVMRFFGMASPLPVVLLSLAIFFYFPIPVLYGAVQGLKKFVTFGFMQMSWGFFRFVFGAVIVIVLAGGISEFMAGIVAATAVTALVSYFPSRPIFAHAPTAMDRREMLHAFGLVAPVILTLFCVTVMKNADVVLAKGYFEAGSADAYTCAATVGSGFFILSAIFMVMFPMVSEEKTRGGNPIMFLYKSCGFVMVLSTIGLAVAAVYPELPMYVFTLGKNVPGAPPLIRLIGYAVIPVALVNIMSNYFLAKHQWRFIPILFAGMLLQLLAIVLVHDTPVQMLIGIIAANFVTLITMILYLVYEHRRFVGGMRLSAVAK